MTEPTARGLLIGYSKETNTVAINVEGAQVNVSIQTWLGIVQKVDGDRKGTEAPAGERVDESTHKADPTITMQAKRCDVDGKHSGHLHGEDDELYCDGFNPPREQHSSGSNERPFA